ncbi:MAG TPA: hypothetical protein VMV41_07850, partial [Cellulomonadaceae bacterium]|nr:hypothetical protein [Cellulomonadaceae bacterium]
DHEMRGLLGPAYDDTTPEQRAGITRASDAIAARWPDEDYGDWRRAALNAAMMVILGDDTLDGIATMWRDLREREQEARAMLTGALIVTPGTERDLAARAGVARETVRKALGR